MKRMLRNYLALGELLIDVVSATSASLRIVSIF